MIKILKFLFGKEPKNVIKVNWWFSNGWTMKSSCEIVEYKTCVSDSMIISEFKEQENKSSSWSITSIEKNGMRIYPKLKNEATIQH